MSANNRCIRAAAIVTLLPVFLLLGQQRQGADPWPSEALAEPADVAALVGVKDKIRPAIFFVGFPNLYSGAHVRSAELDGPASKPAGIEELRRASVKLPRSQPVIIYCGCCPFDKCPNVRPAYELLKAEGFTDVKVIKMPVNFHTDWVAKGYPIARGAAAEGSR